MNLFKNWHRSAIGIVTAGCGLLTLVYVIWQIFGLDGSPYKNFVNDGAQALTSLAAFLVTYILSRSEKLEAETRRAWRLVATAYFFFACAQMLWFYYRQIEGAEPFPSFVDLGFLAFYPLMLSALLLFPTAKQTSAARRKLLFDTVTVMIAGTMCVWHFIILPTFEKNTVLLKSILNTAYIVGDMVLFLGIITILLRQPTESVRRALFFIIAGLLNLFVADISFAYVTLHGVKSSGPLVTLWVTGAFLLVLGSFFQYQSATAEKEIVQKETFHAPSFTWLPYAAIAVGYGVLLLSTREHWDEAHNAIIFGALALTAIVVFRQYSAVKENVSLHAAEAARRSETRFRSLIENSSDIVMIFDLNGRISYQSPSLKRILGYEQDSIIGRSGFSFIHPEDIPTIKEAYEILAANPQGEVMRECRFRHRNGSWRILEGIARFIDDGESGMRGILLNARDINERRNLESKLKHQAFHDPLTNLANRVLFRSRVEGALARSAGKTSQVAVLFLDLDNFKHINDTHGHEAGDKFLVEFTEILMLCVRAKDATARLGGDEFAILLEGEHVEQTATIVARRILETVRQSFQIDKTLFKTGVSIGIALNDTPDLTADDLLRNADVAMYMSKSKGKNCFVAFEDEMRQTLLEQIELEGDLREAVENEQIALNYQPIVSLENAEISGMEALARWHHPTRGFVSPEIFIPIAEQSSLIIQLGRRIMYEACRQSREFSAKFGKKITVTVNISSKQIQHPGFVGDLADVLLMTGIAPENLILELTEGTMMENTETMLKLLHQIKSLGIRLAVDDFGTGYSSLSYLQQFPIDILKIDRSFVDGIEHSTQKNAVARTIVSLSSALQLATVAEGIETREQNEILRELGCQYGQGYFFARPLTVEQFETILENRNADSSIVAGTTESLPELVSKSIN